MRTLIITILFLFSVAANATTYYVSNAGSDAANGTSSGTSWQTISKVNGFAFATNDSILFKRGDTWNEQLITPRTYLHFDAYGTGNKPLITGFQTVTGFTNVGNVWTATATNAVNDLNCVLLNGNFAIKARYPNTGYLTFGSYSGDSIINTSETGTPSRVGKEIAVRTATWIIDVSKVLTQSTGQLKLSPKLTTTPNLLGNGYFFQNDASFIDVTNEYSYDNATKSLSVYSTTSPTVKVSIIDTLVKTKSHTTFENISFTGANRLLINVDTSTTIKNCLLQYSGWDALEGENNGGLIVDADSIVDIWNNGIAYDWIVGGHKLTVTNTYIKRIGTAAGMGGSGNGTYTAILEFADSALIKHNTLDSIGYNGIHFQLYPTSIDSNYITHCGITKADAGSIYTFFGLPGNIIRGNIVGNNPGGTGGISGNDIANLIYLDDNTSGQIVSGNALFNAKWAACFIHVNSGGSTFTNNLFRDSIDRPFFINGSAGSSFTNNTFHSLNPLIDAFYSDNTSQTFSGNRFLRQTLPSNLIHYGSSFYNYNTFSADASAMTMPVYGNTTVVDRQFINPTLHDSTISLDVSKTYVDINGKFYNDSITLKPYGWIELFESTLIILPKVYTTP